jgi:hypothetical protein
MTTTPRQNSLLNAGQGRFHGVLTALGTSLAIASLATAQTESPVQSTARPFGLDIVAPVMAAGSDEDSANFQAKVLPGLTAFLEKSLGERSKVDDSRMLLDPGSLDLKNESDVRVYFIGEGAGNRNSLGFNTAGGGATTGDPQLIFPDGSSPVSTYDPAKSPNRTNTAPLLPGDFVDLGRMAAGTMLDFFLIANGVTGGKTVFSTDQSVNADGINHVVAFAYVMANSPYLIIGFEDLVGGGDRDFNDILFAVDIGIANVKDLTATPEPALALTMVTLLGLTLRRRRTPIMA